MKSHFSLKQVMGIEPTYSAWKADVLPLNHTCNFAEQRFRRTRKRYINIYYSVLQALNLKQLVFCFLRREYTAASFSYS